MIRWSKRGSLRRTAIVRLIAQETCDWATAWKWEDSVFKATSHLEQFPFSGRIVPELGRNDIRETRIGDYRIIYRVRDSIPEIISIRHGHFLIHTEKSL